MRESWKRDRGRNGTGGGAGGVEREQGEESECTEVAKKANGEKEQWRGSGGGAVVLRSLVQERRGEGSIVGPRV